MILPILQFVYDRKKLSSPQREGSVELRIYYNRRSKYMTTGISLLPKQWRGEHVTNHIDAITMNQKLSIIFDKANTVVMRMMREGSFDIDSVPSLIRHEFECDKTFAEYARERAAVRSAGRVDGTRKHYKTFIDWLEQWGRIKTFADVNERNIINMDEKLKKQGMKRSSRYANYHKFMKAFITDAMADGLLKYNPYAKLDIKKGDSDAPVRYVTPEEFRRIETCELPTDRLRKVRDLFVFQTYTCLSYVDMAKFDPSLIRYVSGTAVYSSSRVKTKVGFSFVVLKPALRILKKYDWKLPMISNVNYNLYLKDVAAYAKVRKPISSHWARHTGATLLLNDGNVPMKVISKVLGHSTTKITEKVYAKLLDETVVRAMEEFDKSL